MLGESQKRSLNQSTSLSTLSSARLAWCLDVQLLNSVHSYCVHFCQHFRFQGNKVILVAEAPGSPFMEEDLEGALDGAHGTMTAKCLQQLTRTLKLGEPIDARSALGQKFSGALYLLCMFSQTSCKVWQTPSIPVPHIRLLAKSGRIPASQSPTKQHPQTEAGILSNSACQRASVISASVMSAF